VCEHITREKCQTVRSKIKHGNRKSPSGMCAKLRTVAASNSTDPPTRSLYYCLFAPHIYFVVPRAHPVRGESHNQRNANGEVATAEHFLRCYVQLLHSNSGRQGCQIFSVAYGQNHNKKSPKWLCFKKFMAKIMKCFNYGNLCIHSGLKMFGRQ